MESFWQLLALEPTRDADAIKRSYAQKARTCHPEEDAEGFLRLREAYRAALDYAEGQDASAPPAADGQDGDALEERRDAGWNPPPARPEEEDAGWLLREDIPETAWNPYQDGGAIRQFLEIYTKKQRKNSRLWMDYFTSDAFLDAGWDSQFTALLLEKITEVESACPPDREFMLWLSVAYQFSLEEAVEINREAFRVEKRERQLHFAPGAEFDGMQSISRIAAKGPVPKKPKGNEFAILQSFQDYRRLVRLAEAGRWDQEAVDAWRSILKRYSQSYIRERCEQQVSPDCERHPAGLRVFLHFFQREDLPELVFRDAWRLLDLKSAIMGRAKALYGPLRDRVLAQVPGILDEAPENFLQLNRNLDAYLAQIKKNPEEEEMASAAFFASPELQKALPSPRFVEEQLLAYTKWRREDAGEGLVRRILAFYRAHPGIPRSGEAASGLEGDLRRLVAKRWSQEDAAAPLSPGSAPPRLAYRPFFRHWLNTGFYTAKDPVSGTALLEYLEDSLPYQKAWSRRFAEKPVTVVMGNAEADFCPLHMAFRVDGKPVYRPCLPWAQTAGVQNDDWFFFLLPITAAPYDAYEDVLPAILDRLASTAAPEEDCALIARCLANQVCRLPLEEYTGKPVPPEEALPLERCAEGGGRLYLCIWREGGEQVTLCQQTGFGRRTQREYQLEPGENPMEAARLLLEEAVSPTRFDLSRLAELPWHIYYTPNGGAEEALLHPDLLDPPKPSEEVRRKVYERLGKALEDAEAAPEMEAEGLEAPQSQGEQTPPPAPVTAEALSSLLVRFGRDELERLEMEWFHGTLVLRRDSGSYACLCFERPSRGEYWYSLLSDPELYRTVDSSDVVYVPFGMGRLPSYAIFDSAQALLAGMDQVLAQVSRGQIQPGGRGGWKWSCAVSLHNGRHKLLMAQQKLGGIPPRRGRSQLLLKFTPSRYPVQLESEDLQGERKLEALRSGSYGQAADGLVQFMMEKLARLRLTWAFKRPDGGAYHRHLVLLRDNGRFMLLWLQDDKAQADAYTADDPVPFLGFAVPACLVHRDLMRLRNCVDLLLDDIDNTGPVTDRPGEFVQLSLPYTEIRASLVKDAPARSQEE